MKKIIVLFILISFLSPQLFAEDVWTVIIKKQEQKKNNSWSLVDWLGTKKKIALMDQWLAVNSTSTPFFEGYIGGEITNYDFLHGSQASIEYKFHRHFLGLYFSILGFEFAIEDSNENYKGTNYNLALRLLGSSAQGTHLNLEIGKRKFEISGGDTFENTFIGANLNFYLVNFLGLEGTYRSYMNAKSALGFDTTGALIEYGAFLDIWALRASFLTFKETYEVSSSTPYEDSREGVRLNFKFFF